ncbi:MAG: glutathione peroxidase [Xanthomonadales bacterium]|nr:glutathione peroxidase [Xanthomonadales bacterium]
MLRILPILLLLVLAMPAAACGELLEGVQFRPLAGKEPVDLCKTYGGKVLLIVNTASKCGFTPQYDGLEKLDAAYKDRGFAVLGFPSNDFRGQEPGTEAEIREFCTLTYGVKFPMFEKVSVKEGEANPFYVKLATAAGGHYPGWNFHKYLVDRDGRLVADYPSKVKPDDGELVAKIEALLAAPAR